MVELHIGERVTVNGRAYEVMGLTAASVRPRRTFLKDLETGDEVVMDTADLAVRSGPEPEPDETS